MKVTCTWTAAVAVLLLLGTEAAAQSAGGALVGVVRDASQAVLPGVALRAVQIESGVPFSVETNAEGWYEFRRLPPGTYDVRATYRGFRPSADQRVSVSAGQAVTFDLVLQIEEVQQAVTVSGEAAPLDHSTAYSSRLVTRSAMTSLPISGRSLEQVALLAPGMIPVRAKDGRPANGFTKTLSSSGSRGVTFLLDGLNLQHAMFADETPGGVSGLLLGMEAVQEIEVLADAYPAYISGSGGPVVSIVSRRGTREWQGTAFDYFRDQSLDARNFFDTTKPELSRHQFGGTIGGPLGRRGATFFASYEGLRERLGRTLFDFVPDEAARQGRLPGGTVTVSPAIRPILDLYPMPNGENFGDGTAAYAHQYVQPTDDHHLNLRSDVELSPRDVLLARYTMHDSTKVAPIELSFEGFDNQLASRNHYLSLEARRVFSSRLINTLQVGFNRSGYSSFSLTRDDLAAAAPMIPGRPAFGRLNIRGLSSFGTDTADLSFQMQQMEVSNTALLSLGRHDLTMGLNWKAYRSDGTYDFFFNGLLIYENLRTFLLNQPQRFTGAVPGSDARRRYRQHLFGFFLQDQFRWTPDLTVSLGVRYDPYTVPTEADDKIANLRNLYDAAPTVGAPFRNPSALDFAPRAGIAWNVGGRDHTVVRAGFGVFYDPVRENIFGYGARIQTPFVTVLTVNNPPFPNPFAGRAGPPREDPIQYDLETPYMMRYHLTVQRALAANLVARVGYVGSRGVHLPRVGDVNTPSPVRVEADGRAFYGTSAGPRQNAAFERVRYTSLDANSNHNELQLGVTRRLQDGFELEWNYSFARSIDDASAYRRSFTNSLADVPPNYYDRTSERGLSNFHIAHSSTLRYAWDLPFGRGATGAVAALVRGWQTAGVVTLSSGYPFSLNVSFDVANNTVREGHRPDLVAGASANPVLGGPNRYFDVSAFTLPARGYLGNVGRNTLIGPGFASFDATLSRRFRLRGRQTIDARLDAFNVLNRANFAAPQNSGTGGVILFNDANGVPVGNAARIFSTAGPARQFQVSARWSF